MVGYLLFTENEQLIPRFCQTSKIILKERERNNIKCHNQTISFSVKNNLKDYAHNFQCLI